MFDDLQMKSERDQQRLFETEDCLYKLSCHMQKLQVTPLIISSQNKTLLGIIPARKARGCSSKRRKSIVEAWGAANGEKARSWPTPNNLTRRAGQGARRRDRQFARGDWNVSGRHFRHGRRWAAAGHQEDPDSSLLKNTIYANAKETRTKPCRGNFGVVRRR